MEKKIRYGEIQGEHSNDSLINKKTEIGIDV